jgi:hypothetical protein
MGLSRFLSLAEERVRPKESLERVRPNDGARENLRNSQRVSALVSFQKKSLERREMTCANLYRALLLLFDANPTSIHVDAMHVLLRGLSYEKSVNTRPILCQKKPTRYQERLTKGSACQR